VNVTSNNNEATFMQRSIALLVCTLSMGFSAAAFAQNSGSPVWENPQMTKFRSIDCPAGVPDLVIDRASADGASGTATLLMGSPSYEERNGSWSLNGSQLEVTGEGISISGVWSGSRFAAHATLPGVDANCSYRVSGTGG
jgi:hypothetical protein